MYKIEQVLVPVDFSTFSRAALTFARAIGDNPPRVHLAHILEPWRPYLRSVLFPYAALGEDDVEFEQELLDEARESLLRHLKVNPDKEKYIAGFTLEYGNIKDTLGDRVRSVGPDLVVMGAFGEGGVQPYMLGSTAEKLLRSVQCPTVLVRNFEPSPKVEHIVVGVDLSPSSVDIVARALGFALTVGATLELVYVLPDPLINDTNKLLARSLDFDAGKILERSRSRIEALFDRMVDQVQVSFPAQEAARELLATRKVVVGDPSRALVDHADRADADLIVVGAHNTATSTTRQLGRVAWTVARSAPTHVMVVPPKREVSLLDGDDS
jgi:nucleotide-binding universal stress UspA family protein